MNIFLLSQIHNDYAREKNIYVAKRFSNNVITYTQIYTHTNTHTRENIYTFSVYLYLYMCIFRVSVSAFYPPMRNPNKVPFSPTLPPPSVQNRTTYPPHSFDSRNGIYDLVTISVFRLLLLGISISKKV